jgi:N utilization substance protein B
MSGDEPTRHQSRERALSLLYEAELKGTSPLEVVSALPVVPDDYALALVEAVERYRERADGLVSGAAVGWPLDRMAVIDRLVMRLAVTELLMDGGPPVPVVIDEAVELASTYSTDRSGAFVNGVLSTVAAELTGEGIPVIEPEDSDDPDIDDDGADGGEGTADDSVDDA